MGKGFNFKSLFITPSDDETSTTSSPESAPVTQKSAEATAPVYVAPAAVSGKPDDTIVQSLNEALEKANLPGFDYFEFAKMVDALKPTIPSEQVQFITVMTSAKAIDKTVTVHKLLDSTDVYLKVLKDKQTEFENLAQGMIASTVTAKEKEVNDIQKQIDEKAKAIQTLSDEINSLTSAKTEAANQVAVNKGKIEQVYNNFKATMDIFVTRITTDVDKIKKYLSSSK